MARALWETYATPSGSIERIKDMRAQACRIPGVKVVTILGARPQFIKAAAVSRAIGIANTSACPPSSFIDEAIVYTGQHFDTSMSKVFFKQLSIPTPRINLGVAGLGHGAMTGRMLELIEQVLLDQRPDWVLVYGDTNSTLAGALAAAKAGIPVAHVEAGLRSYNMDMPEEINRVLTDRLSTALLCPTARSVQTLLAEGFPFSAPGKRTQSIAQVGDVMLDVVRYVRPLVERTIDLGRWQLSHRNYALCTIHRQENTDSTHRLNALMMALGEVARHLPVVLPLHPRTKAKLDQIGDPTPPGVTIIDPLPYLEMQRLLMSARVVLTDSGGLQKEAYFHGIPCITLREETEWVETVESGWNVLTGTDPQRVSSELETAWQSRSAPPPFFGDGKAAEAVVRHLLGD